MARKTRVNQRPRQVGSFRRFDVLAFLRFFKLRSPLGGLVGVTLARLGGVPYAEGVSEHSPGSVRRRRTPPWVMDSMKPMNPERVPHRMADDATLSGLDSRMVHLTQGGASRRRRFAYPGLLSFSLSGKDAADLFTVCPTRRPPSWLRRYCFDVSAFSRFCVSVFNASSFSCHSAAFSAQPWPGSAALNRCPVRGFQYVSTGT